MVIPEYLRETELKYEVLWDFNDVPDHRRPGHIRGMRTDINSRNRIVKGVPAIKDKGYIRRRR